MDDGYRLAEPHEAARTIEEMLREHGITHQRDSKTDNDGRHTLFRDGLSIGRYDAHEAVEKILIPAKQHADQCRGES